MPGFVLKPLADADNDRVCGIVAESCSGNPVISPNVTCVVRDLPEEVEAKIYRENAIRLLKVEGLK